MVRFGIRYLSFLPGAIRLPPKAPWSPAVLKHRIIATLLWNGQTLVKGVGFDAWRSVGHPLQAINVFQMREVDEILFLDITATREGRPPDFRLIETLAEHCFVPLTVGGGVKSVDDVRELLRAGADKVCMKSALHRVGPDASEQFGRQALVGCFDHEFPHSVWIDAQWASGWGVGEILVQSVPSDGTMRGYDLQLYRHASGYDCPIIASGGCGTYQHMAQAIDAGASAVAAGAMWLFTEQTPLEAKKYLAARGYPVRL